MSKVVVVPFAVLALSLVIGGCDSGGDTNTTVSPPEVTVNPPEVTTTINNPPVTTVATLTATIAGRVVDSSSGFPIAGATVSVNAPGVVATSSTSALAGQEGSFSIQNIPRTETNSPVILTVTGGTLAGRSYPFSTNAVVSLASAGGVGGAGQVVQPNVVLAGIEIELHDQAGRITGLIVGPTGQGLPGVQISLSPVQIPVITPGAGTTGPTTGVFPFTLTTQTVTTSSTGTFSLDGVPEDWIYDISVIPGGGAQVLTFTNQFVPSGSLLNFPDISGPPQDSGFVQALVLAGVVPVPPGGLGAFGGIGVAVPATFAAGCPTPPGCPALGGGPVVVIPFILPGDQADQIPPFIVDNSPTVDGTTIAAAQNVPGLALNVTVSEPLGNTVGELQANIGLTLAGNTGLAFANMGPIPFVGGPLVGSAIPIQVSLDTAARTITIIPQVSDSTGMALALPAGVYAISGLAALKDTAGNAYTGFTSNIITRGGLDAAGAVEFAGFIPAVPPAPPGMPVPDFEIDIVILGDTTLPGAPAVAGIMCSDCQNGGMAGAVNFNVTFDSVPNAVQYFGAFATAGDGTFTTVDGNGLIGVCPNMQAFCSAGPLADPPENVTFMLGGPGPVGAFDFTVPPGDGARLLGFTYPLVAGTQTLALTVPNNYFDDGISYQVGIIAVNAQGIRGPQATALVSDVTPPGFDTSGASIVASVAVGVPPLPGTVSSGNDINFVIGAGTVPAANNMTTIFYPLENIFSSTDMEAMFTAESIAIREGPVATAGMPIVGTVGFDFYGQVVAPPGSVSEVTGFVDTFYRMADIAAFATVPSIGLNIRLNEQIDTTATLTAPTLTSPDATMLATSPLAFAAVDNGAALTFMNVLTAFGGGILNAFGDTSDGTVSIASTADGDMVMDEDVIEVQLSNIWAPESGDQVNFTGTGLVDEAGNALAANTTLLLANHIPAAIASAVAAPGTTTTDVLTLTFTRPIFLPTATIDAAGLVLLPLGLAEAAGVALPATVVGGMAVLSNAGMTLTITTMQGFLSGLTTNTVIDGTGLFTNDPLNFLVGAGLGALPVNTFAGTGAAGDCPTPCLVALFVEDQIPPSLTLVTDFGFAGDLVNNGVAGVAAGNANDGLLELGDMTANELIVLGFTFDEPVLSGNEDGTAGFASTDIVAAGITLSFANPAGGTANFFVNPVTPSTTPPTATRLFFDVVLNSAGGGPVLVGTTITINGVDDLSGNLVTNNTVTLCTPANGAAIVGVRVCP